MNKIAFLTVCLLAAPAFAGPDDQASAALALASAFADCPCPEGGKCKCKVCDDKGCRIGCKGSKCDCGDRCKCKPAKLKKCDCKNGGKCICYKGKGCKGRECRCGEGCKCKLQKKKAKAPKKYRFKPPEMFHPGRYWQAPPAMRSSGGSC